MTLKFWKYLITDCHGSAICIVADQDRECAEKELECNPRLHRLNAVLQIKELVSAEGIEPSTY